jgi:hypothetical protein
LYFRSKGKVFGSLVHDTGAKYKLGAGNINKKNKIEEAVQQKFDEIHKIAIRIIIIL